MPNQAGTIELIAKELGLVFRPLENLLTPYFTEILGLRLPEAIANKAQWKNTLTDCQNAVGGMITSLDILSEAIGDEDVLLIASEGIVMIEKIIDIIDCMKAMSSTLNNLASSTGGVSGDEKTEIQGFANEFVRKLVEYLVVENIESRFKANAALLNITGILERNEMPGVPGNPLRPPFIQRKLHLDRISDLFKDPSNYLASAYKWGHSDFEAERLLKNIQEFVKSLELPAELFELNGEPTLEAFLFSLANNSSGDVPKLDFTINFPATQDVSFEFPIEGVWSSTVTIGARFLAGFSGEICPPIDIYFDSDPDFEAALNVAMGVKAQDVEGPMIIFGTTEGSRIQAESFSAELGVETEFKDGKAQTEPLVRSSVLGGKVIIDFSEGDGFITSILKNVDIEGSFDVLAKWQPSKGLKIEGSGGIEIAIPVHINLGIAELHRLYFELVFGGASALRLGVSTALSLNIGPFQAAIDKMGLNTFIDFPSGGDGNLGPLNLKFAFKPPTGLGLAINSGPVRGGGFIFFDPDKGEYGGVAELTVVDIVSVKAICIITTKNPDGSKGFSFLLVISAEFTPIQLGFGFTLNGVGGLIGINRGISSSAIVQGVREGAIDQVMFPENPVANAPIIIASMNAYFPINQGQYAFGFMGILGWGTPTLITLEMGFMFTFPEPVSFIILGVLKMQLPDEKVPLVNLNVSFIGEINFTEKYIFFFASLYGSRIAQWTVSGDMYFAIDYGDNPNFVFSVGGFHPDFVPPPLKGGVGQLQRLTLNLLPGDNPRLRLTFYLAVTSNTVQFGAAADFMAKAWKIRVVGYLYFDALFQFNPFYFIVSIGAGLAVMWGSRELFGIHLAGSLEGPSPWRIKGRASFRILFVKVKVRVDKTFGERKNTELPPMPILPFIREPLEDIRNWVASRPDARTLLVTTRKLDSEDLVVHPYSIVGVSQNRVPLKIDLDKVGSNEPSDYNKFKLRLVGADQGGEVAIKDFFAPAEYIDLSDAQKISRKSFEKFNAGVKSNGQDGFYTSESDIENMIYGDYVEKTLEHELAEVDEEEEDSFTPKQPLVEDGTNFELFVKGNAVALSQLGQAKTVKNAVLNHRVQLSEDTYQIVDRRTLMSVKRGDTTLSFNTETQAFQLVDKLVKAKPKLKGVFQVISTSEMN